MQPTREAIFSPSARIVRSALRKACLPPHDSVIEVLHGILHEHPPVLVGSTNIAAVDRIIRRALAKEPEERYPSAAAMAEE